MMTMRDPLPVELERWRSQNLISDEQSNAILAAEAARSAAADTDDRASVVTVSPQSRRRAVLAEVIGSLGAIAAAVAAVVGTAVLWPDLTSAARTAIPAIGSVGLLAAGGAVPRNGDRSSERLGALLWLLAVGAVAATTAIVTTDVLELDGQNVVLITGVVALALSVALVRRCPTPHLVVAIAGSAVGVAVGLVLQYDEAQAEHVGVVLVCLGAAVILLGWAEVLPQRSTAIVAGASTTLVGAEMLGGLEDHWPIVAGAIAALGLLTLFVTSRDRAALVSGLGIAVVVVVQGVVLVADRDQGGGNGNRWVVLVVFALGAGVLAASIIAIRSGGRPRRPA